MGRYVGQTNFGDGLHVRAIVNIRGIPKADSPALLGLDSVSDAGVITTRYIWVDSNGVVRVHNTIPTDQDSDGTAVAQTLVSGIKAASTISVTQIGTSGVYKGSTTITVTGLSTGNKVFVSVNGGTDAEDVFACTGYVSASNTITVSFLATQSTSVNVGFSYVVIPS